MKVAYQSDREGYFVGTVELDPSPREPGIYLIPGGAVEQAPPRIPPGSAARLLDGAWQIVPDPGGMPGLDEPVALTEAQVLDAWRARTAVTAYQAKAALFNRGLLDDAEAAATAAGGLILLPWQTATQFQRNATSIADLAPAIGIVTPEDLDALFREAAAITA